MADPAAFLNLRRALAARGVADISGPNGSTVRVRIPVEVTDHTVVRLIDVALGIAEFALGDEQPDDAEPAESWRGTLADFERDNQAEGNSEDWPAIRRALSTRGFFFFGGGAAPEYKLEVA